MDRPGLPMSSALPITQPRLSASVSTRNVATAIRTVETSTASRRRRLCSDAVRTSPSRCGVVSSAMETTSRAATPPAAGARLASRPRSPFLTASIASAATPPMTSPSSTAMPLRRRSRASTGRAWGSMTTTRRRLHPRTAPTARAGRHSMKTTEGLIGTPCIDYVIQESGQRAFVSSTWYKRQPRTFCQAAPMLSLR